MWNKVRIIFNCYKEALNFDRSILEKFFGFFIFIIRKFHKEHTKLFYAILLICVVSLILKSYLINIFVLLLGPDMKPDAKRGLIEVFYRSRREIVSILTTFFVLTWSLALSSNNSIIEFGKNNVPRREQVRKIYDRNALLIITIIMSFDVYFVLRQHYHNNLLISAYVILFFIISFSFSALIFYGSSSKKVTIGFGKNSFIEYCDLKRINSTQSEDMRVFYRSCVSTVAKFTTLLVVVRLFYKISINN